MFSHIKNNDKTHIAGTYGRFDVCFTKGEGARLYDIDGKEYIDFSSGIGVNSLGVGDSDWTAAVTKQAQELPHISNLFYTEPCTTLAEKLTTATKLSNVFFCNSGAEANECAIKAARKYSFDKYGRTDRGTILSLKNSFHGRTIATVTATGQDSFHDFFHPFPQGFQYVPADNTEIAKYMMNDTVCAIIVECIQGEGGVIPICKQFLQDVEQIAKEKDILIIIDEVQTGIGRTGTLFAFEQYGITPDIVTAAKGLGGGLPIGAVLFGTKCKNTLQAGHHGSTFGANPVVCAGANIVLNKVNNKEFLQNVVKKGEIIKESLLSDSTLGIKEIRGKGLMLGIDIDGIEARPFAEKLLKNGLVALTAKAAIRLLPPLTITEEELQKGIEILKKTIVEYKSEKTHKEA